MDVSKPSARAQTASARAVPDLVDFESFIDDYLHDLHQAGGRGKLQPGAGFPSTSGRPSAQQHSNEGHASDTHRSPDKDGMMGSSDDSGPNSPVQPQQGRRGAAGQKALGAKSSASKRTLELQEKNRRAQRRFRERQKNKVAELEGRVEELSAAIQALTGDKANLESRVSILVRVLQMRDDQLEQMRRKLTSDGEIAASMEDLKMTVSEGQEMTLTPEQVRNLSRDGLVRIWKNYVQQLAGLLVENEKNPGDAKVLKKTEQLTEEVSMLCMRLHLSNPKATREFVAQKLEETQMEHPEVEIAGRWLNLARSLGLSPEQRQELVQLRRLFFQKMAVIAEQRQEIHSQLTNAMPAPSFSRTTAIQSLRAHDSIDQLRYNLREEHILKMDWVLTLFKHTLGPLQVARVLVQAWPWSPDTLSMATFVAAEEGDAEALAALSAATRGLLLNPSVPVPFDAMPASRIIDAAAQVVPHLLTSASPDPNAFGASLPSVELDFSLHHDELAAANRFMSLPAMPLGLQHHQPQDGPFDVGGGQGHAVPLEPGPPQQVRLQGDGGSAQPDLGGGGGGGGQMPPRSISYPGGYPPARRVESAGSAGSGQSPGLEFQRDPVSHVGYSAANGQTMQMPHLPQGDMKWEA